VAESSIKHSPSARLILYIGRPFILYVPVSTHTGTIALGK